MVPEGWAISRQGSPDNSRSRSSRAGADRERVRYPSPHPLAARTGWLDARGRSTGCSGRRNPQRQDAHSTGRGWGRKWTTATSRPPAPSQAGRAGVPTARPGPASPVCHTPSSPTQSKPSRATLASVTSSSVARALELEPALIETHARVDLIDRRVVQAHGGNDPRAWHTSQSAPVGLSSHSVRNSRVLFPKHGAVWLC